MQNVFRHFTPQLLKETNPTITISNLQFISFSFTTIINFFAVYYLNTALQTRRLLKSLKRVSNLKFETMKTLLSAFMTLFLVLGLIYSCSEKENDITLSKDTISSTRQILDIENINNPFEYVGIASRNAILFANENSSNCDNECYRKLIDIYFKANPIYYNISNELLSTSEQSYWSQYKMLVFSNDFSSVIDKLIDIENKVANSTLLQYEKDRLLVSFSSMKYIMYTAQSDGINQKYYYEKNHEPTPFDICFDNCITRKMTFDNWMEEAIFMAGLPMTAIYMFASCTWECGVESK